MNFTGKILLVDDEAHIRKYLSLLVKQVGSPTVVEAPNGAAGVEVFLREKPDMVLLDVNMPIMDGIETLKKLMELDPDVVVVMLTSLVNRQTIESALEFGAVNYIRKDTAPDEIVKALEEVITECFPEAGAAPSPEA